MGFSPVFFIVDNARTIGSELQYMQFSKVCGPDFKGISIYHRSSRLRDCICHLLLRVRVKLLQCFDAHSAHTLLALPIHEVSRSPDDVVACTPAFLHHASLHFSRDRPCTAGMTPVDGIAPCYLHHLGDAWLQLVRFMSCAIPLPGRVGPKQLVHHTVADSIIIMSLEWPGALQ